MNKYTRNTDPDNYDEPGISLDEIARQHGYSDYSDYCDEYYEGHTGCELGEPAVWDTCLDDDEDDMEENRSEDYCEGFSDGYSEGYEDGYEDGYTDGMDGFDDYCGNDECEWDLI